MAASIIRYDHFYVASSGAMGAAAQVNDVIVVACMAKSATHATCTVTGATATMAEQQFTYQALDPAGITFLTGLVTGAGTPTLTLNSLSDQAFAAWIVRGVSSATANAAGGNTGSGNPLVTSATLAPSITSSLFIAYLDEPAGGNFTSFTMSVTTDNSTTTHADASGHQLDVTSGNYTPGVNLTAGTAFHVMSAIFLPNTGGVSSPNVTAVGSATPANGSALIITGTAFGASQGTGGVTLGGIAQTVTSWADTSITITVARGTNKYGTPLSVIVTNNAGVASNTFSGVTGITAQSGWSFVNISTPDPIPAHRLQAVADLASGDQVAWDTKVALVTVLPDASYYAAQSVTTFNAEAWTSGGWGALGLQTINVTAPPPPPPDPTPPPPVPPVTPPAVGAGRWNKVL